jgi:hypothetical protein
MSLARIREQAQKADQLIEEARKASQPAAEEPTPEVQEQTETQVEEPTEDQGVAAEGSVEEQDTDTRSADHREQAELWEQRYRSLDGMIKSRDKQIQQLHELLAGMQQASQQKSSPSEDDQPLVTKKDEEDFGSELVDMARRAAREEFRSLKAEFMRDIDELRNSVTNVTEVTQLTAQDRFEMQLDGHTSKRWRELDSDPKFINWLKSSPVRNKVFVAAVQEQEATTVAEFFNDYAALANQQREKADEPKKTRVAELEKQVSPGKSKSVGTPDSQAGGKKTWTRTEISQTYANKKQYKADEFQQLEREIATAQREGRVNYAA